MGEHLINGQFQSDKYPWCLSGFVPLKLTDPNARLVLKVYAELRRSIDEEFSNDLIEAIRIKDKEEPWEGRWEFKKEWKDYDHFCPNCAHKPIEIETAALGKNKYTNKDRLRCPQCGGEGKIEKEGDKFHLFWKKYLKKEEKKDGNEKS